MVLLSFQDRDGVRALYTSVKEAACGRQTCSVAILVAHDVDAISSCRMLSTLLRGDKIGYMIHSVVNYLQVVQRINEFVQSDSIRTIFLINCGAVYNLPKLFGESKMRCIVFDNHRPFHLANVYSSEGVVVLENEDTIDELRGEMPGRGDGDDLSVGETDDDDDENDLYDDVGSLIDDDDEDEEGSFVEGDGDGEEEEEDDNDNDEDNAEDDSGSNAAGDPDADDADTSGEQADTSNEENEEAVQDESDSPPAAIFDEEDEENVVVVGKKRKALADQYDPLILRKRQIRAYYERGNFFSSPTSALLINLVKIRGVSVTPDLMWQAILGTTDQYLRSNISEDLYNVICDAITAEVANLGGENKFRVSDGEGSDFSVQSSENGRVETTMDYRFFLYRHWSLYEAMYYSPYVAAKLCVWKQQGSNKLQEMLARIGLPLQESKQLYNYMKPEFKSSFRQFIEEGVIAEEFNLREPGVMFKSFSRYNSFRTPVAASDVVYAATALLEIRRQDAADMDTDAQMASFNRAYESVSIKEEMLLHQGIEAAKDVQTRVVKQAALMLEKPDAIIKVKKFRYAYIYRGSEVETAFSRPMVLTRLGQFLMQVQKENRKWINRNALPLVLLSERKSSFIVVGLSPSADAINMPKEDGTEVFLPLEQR
jgi:cell division control protein 45